MTILSKMKSKTTLAFCVATLLATSVATANTSNNTDQRMTYTASGTTSIKNVKLFQQLLKNSHNLTVSTKINRRPKQQTMASSQTRNRANNRSVDYTVKGKTSIKNVRKLMDLFNRNKNVEMIVQAKTNSANTVQVARFTINNTGLYNQHKSLSQYQPVYSNYYTRYVPYHVWQATEQFNGYPMPNKAQLHKDKDTPLQRDTLNSQANKVTGFII